MADPDPQSSKVTERIKACALEILKQYPAGLKYSELRRQIKAADAAFELSTIGAQTWNLDQRFPDKVWKPSRGLFQLLEFKLQEDEWQSSVKDAAAPAKVLEADFYQPFVDWLKNEIEDVTHAIALGGNKFKDKWGTPDVIGKREAARSDIIKGETEIVSAEIKTDTGQLITAFGQACSYKLFSHKAYLVVPRQASDDDISRVDSLCQIFGIGFVTFDADHPDAPDFQIRVRPARHLPDLFYTNKYAKLIEAELFR